MVDEHQKLPPHDIGTKSGHLSTQFNKELPCVDLNWRTPEIGLTNLQVWNGMESMVLNQKMRPCMGKNSGGSNFKQNETIFASARDFWQLVMCEFPTLCTCAYQKPWVFYGAEMIFASAAPAWVQNPIWTTLYFPLAPNKKIKTSFCFWIYDGDRNFPNLS